jgi:aminoglycoside phosphotransferase family enzyme
MRRLPAARMLDHLILHKLLLPSDVAAVGRQLGEFFAVQPAVEIGADRHVGQLRRQLEISMRLIARPQFALPPATLATVHGALRRFLDDGAELAARIQARRIVEGHGDLRPEHVCLLTPPVIIDCLEFSRDLRFVDPFDEIAFLGLECARMGAPEVGAWLQHTIEQRLQDHPSARLIAFYTALRACIRAHLAVAHLLEPEPRTPPKWLPLARDYLARAAQACAELA